MCQKWVHLGTLNEKYKEQRVVVAAAAAAKLRYRKGNKWSRQTEREREVERRACGGGGKRNGQGESKGRKKNPKYIPNIR